MPILRSLQYVMYKCGDFQKASRISVREPSISINSIFITYKFIHNVIKGRGPRHQFFKCNKSKLAALLKVLTTLKNFLRKKPQRSITFQEPVHEKLSRVV